MIIAVCVGLLVPLPREGERCVPEVQLMRESALLSSVSVLQRELLVVWFIMIALILCIGFMWVRSLGFVPSNEWQ